MNLAAIQAFLREHQLDAWLVHDFRHSNALLARLLPTKNGLRRHLTRRVALCIHATRAPVVLCSPLDANAFREETIEVREYPSWQGFHSELRCALDGCRRVAMEYAPGASLPVVSVVDAGTIELIRSFGIEVASSADVMQAAVAVWSDEAVAAHAKASALVNQIKDDAFALIRSAITAGGTIHEHAVVVFMREQFKAKGLEWPDGPIVGVNAHSGDPHYEPSPERPAEIKRGDWVLIDLWARVPGEPHIFSDVTWTGFAGTPAQLPPKHREVFNVVRDARDASLKRAQAAWASGQTVQGWQLDDAAREVIIRAGFERGIKHRTGHSLSAGTMVHGLGMNLDNLETHDTRVMLAGTGFTIEPGIYLPQELGFGVRNEINVYVDPQRGPVVTSGAQNEPVWCG